MTIFDFKDYQKFLQEWVKNQPNRGRGLQIKLAEAAGVQPTFISQIFNYKAHPSVEQAYALTQFMDLKELEAEYFQLLVQIERAGSIDYKKHLEKKKSELLKKAKKISSFLSPQSSPSDLDVQKYFSSWIYPVVHLLSQIPEFSNSKAMATRLGLKKEVIDDALSFLLKSGVIENHKDGYHTTTLRMHAEKGSAKLMGYQMTTRSRVQQKIAEGGSDDLHFTSIHSSSYEDFEKLRSQILELIRASDKRIEKSEAENVFGFTIDLFQI